jgi:DNA-binding Lrp family transcriptional regulator
VEKSMARKSVIQIKKDENKILSALKKNARGSIEEIAKKYHFSRQKVWRIIKRLEEANEIWGYYTVVDDEKNNRKRFVILIKRSTEPIDDAIQKIIDLTLHKKGEKIGIEIESSSYLHGRYDWMFVITADDIKSVSRFSNLLVKEYQIWISEVHILEDIFQIKKCGIVNPNADKLKKLI